MRDLVRSGLARTVVFEGRRYDVPAPVLQDACEVILSAEGAAGGVAEDYEVFEAALRRWLPLRLSSVLRCRVVSLQTAIDTALHWILEGVAPLEKIDTLDPAGVRNFAVEMLYELKLADKISDYAAAFFVDPYYVYTHVPWTVFLLFHRQGDRVVALREYERMRTRSLPYIESPIDRKKAVDELLERAGLKKPDHLLSREEKIERQKQELARLGLAMGRSSWSGGEMPQA